jgi:acyl-coenzyme A thioesterase PaaI-like protein
MSEMKRSQIYHTIQKLNKLPVFLQTGMKSFFIGRAVSFVGTSGLRFEKTTTKEWVASISNKPSVRNHLGQLHACAMVLLAESIAILIVAMNLPDDKLPLVKNINADFVKRSTGGMRAKISLTDEQINYIQSTEKGELPLAVEIVDSAGIQPIVVTVTAVWIPKKRK